MNIIDEIIKNPDIVQRVDCHHRYSNFEARLFNDFRNAKYKDAIKNDIVRRIADYLVKEHFIVFEEKNDGGETTIAAKLFVVDLSKIKNKKEE